MAHWVKNLTAVLGSLKPRVPSSAKGPSVAAAQIQSLAPELPYAVSVAIKKKKVPEKKHWLHARLNYDVKILLAAVGP